MDNVYIFVPRKKKNQLFTRVLYAISTIVVLLLSVAQYWLLEFV